MIVVVLTALVLSLELIFAIAAGLSHVPVSIDGAFVHSLEWHYQRNFFPQRNLFLYSLWLVLGTACWAFLSWLRQRFPGKLSWEPNLFLIFHSVVVFLMGHALFEIIALGNPFWAWPVFWLAFGIGVLVTIFWAEFRAGVILVKKILTDLKIKPWIGVVLGSVFIFLVIFMPDLRSVVAMEYQADYFHDWDADFFGNVFASSKGMVPGVDVRIYYGFGAAVMVGKIVNFLGGFDYVRVIGVLMWIGIVYFILWFLLLRRFLTSTLLAFAAIVCAMRMQMFNSMLDPFVWTAVMASVFRYCFDIGLFWMLWMHIQTRRLIFLAAAAFFVACGIYHMFSTGISMFLVFGLYAVVSAFVSARASKDWKPWRDHGLVLISVAAWTLVWFFLTVGTHLWQAGFWANLMEFNNYFTKGMAGSSLLGPIAAKNYVLGLGGLLYPVFYLGTFLYIANLALEGKAGGKDIFAALLAFYGLEAHAYYILMVTQWYSMGIPGIFLAFYWIDTGLQRITLPWRQRVIWGLVVASCYCLLTDIPFIRYPNLLSVSRNPIVDDRTYFRVGPKQIPYFHQLLADFPESFKLPLNSLGEKDEQLKFESDFTDDAALKTYYATETAWPEDTAMIRRLTPEGGRAALLCSYELLFLQRSGRKPFFYYFPIINSRPLRARNFMVTRLFSYPQIQKVIDQMETEKPPYIFMERIFLTPQVPMAYFNEFDDLIDLLRYVLSHYEPAEVGKYLVAMKRK